MTIEYLLLGELALKGYGHRRNASLVGVFVNVNQTVCSVLNMKRIHLLHTSNDKMKRKAIYIIAKPYQPVCFEQMKPQQLNGYSAQLTLP